MPYKTNTCRRCKDNKEAKYFYTQRRNTSGLESICKECKKIEFAARRYNVSEQFIEHLYTFENCMACQCELAHGKLTHIHHLDSTGIRGIVCFSCNYILSDESNENKDRILRCLKFMARDNLLDTVNQQGRPISMDTMPEPSETTRRETLLCKQCKRGDLIINDFHKQKSRQPRRICKHCFNTNRRLLAPFKELRELKTHCECCKAKFTKQNKSCVHHTGTTIHGVICNRCNQLLGNETPLRRQQLMMCLEFMI